MPSLPDVNSFFNSYGRHKQNIVRAMNRRTFLSTASLGLGSLALGQLINPQKGPG
jgi:hypothetical protein